MLIGLIVLGLFIAAISGTAYFLAINRAGAWGAFSGDVHAKWNGDRDMVLLDDFSYVDVRGKKWNAPKDSVINGASIPRAFWSITGGPYEGKYRNASVVHDVACVEMNEPWQDVHLMFYEACRCGGMGETEAKILYLAVNNFGPRWERVEIKAGPDMPPQTEVVVTPTTEPTQEQMNLLSAYVRKHNPDPSEIRKLSIEQLAPAE
jgi:hypothetical protein